MRSSARSLFTTIRTEGAILPSELLERIAKGRDFEGLTPDSYHLLAGQKLNEVIERSWKQVLVAWCGFKEAREKSGDLDATGTSLTRERWLYPLFQELGFGRIPAERKAREIDGREYFISHYYDHVPIHLIGYKIEVDRRTAGIPGAAKTAPHSLVQEFLNRTEEHLWAIVSNGLRLRLLRDNKSLTRQAYVEFDLEAMLESDTFADFRVLWLLCHQSRFEAEKPTDCWLEKWSKIASEQGVRALDKLRGGVEEAIRALGKGFLAHRANHHLRSKLREGQLDRQDYYRQLLRVVYRLLFLFVAEDRDLLLLPELQGDEPDEAKRQRRLARARYQQHFGTQRLRSLSQIIRGTQHPDLWREFQFIMRGLGQKGGIPALAVPALGSYLWSEEACLDLAGMEAIPAADIANADFLTAVRALAVIEVESRRTVVNYAHLRSEELGSVYESLLELHPQLNAEAGTFDLYSAAGNERKTTGSYYTPDSLVQCLLDSALEPVMDEKEALARRVAQKVASGQFERDHWTPEEIALVVPRGADPQEALALRVVELANLSATDRLRLLAEAALLGMRVCDPACGSGHFLIAAAHRIARRVARVRTGDEEPTPEALQHAMRDVVGRCLYGVDINPMALELAKVALWMEAIEPGKPLGFLDAHFQCGNALLGTTPELIASGLPDGAFTALTGDDKGFVSALKKRNKQEREGGQLEFLTATGTAIPVEVLEDLAKGAQALFEANADSLADVQRIAANYEEFHQSPAFQRARFVADLWCAAFVWPKVEAKKWKDRVQEAEQNGLPLPGPRDYPEPPTHALIQRCAQHPEPWNLLSEAQHDMLDRLVGQFLFIQWHVLFADVFRTMPDGENTQSGFEAMLGNPPWERVKLQEKEFFAQRVPEIANAANAAARKQAIERLSESDPGLLSEFAEAQRQSEGESHLMRSSGVYPLCGRGDINVYTIFAELGRCRLAFRGLMGFVLPSGIATDDTTKFYFQDLINTASLVSLFDFENKGIFPAVDSRMKFCLFTCGSGHGVPAGRKPGQAADFVFYAHEMADIQDETRRFTLTGEDIKRLNPNSETCPILRFRRDAALLNAIYLRTPALVTESDTGSDNWGCRLLRMFDMTNDGPLMKTKVDLEGLGATGKGRLYFTSQQTWYPVYEGKMVSMFDHRDANIKINSANVLRQQQAEVVTDAEHLDPEYFARPYLWGPESEGRKRTPKDWHREWFIGFKRVTAATNERTIIGCILPWSTISYTLYLVTTPEHLQDRVVCLAANLFSFVADYVIRQKTSQPSLPIGVVEETAILPPSTYTGEADELGAGGSGVSPITKRVLELSYTTWDLEPFARDCCYNGPPFIWDEERRFWIRAELDAAFFHLYLGTPEEWTRTGSPELLESFPTPRHAVDYIMETFPIVKRKDEKAHGSYRTKEAILDIYDAMAEAIRTGQSYQTVLDPPPGPPTDAEGNFIPMAQWDPNNWPKHIHPPKEMPMEIDVPAVVEEIPVPGMDFEFDDGLHIPVGGVEAFVWAILPRLLTFESPMPFGIARDAALLASDPIAMKLLLNENDTAAVEKLLPSSGSIDFTGDRHRVRLAEMTDALTDSEVLKVRGTIYETGDRIQEHLDDHPVPAFLQGLLPLAVKAAKRLDELRTIYTRERSFSNPQHQQAQERIDARVGAIA
jgi:hypothetical protein